MRLIPFEWFDKLWNHWYSGVSYIYTQTGKFAEMRYGGLDMTNVWYGLIWFLIWFCIGAFLHDSSKRNAQDQTFALIAGGGAFGGLLFAVAFPPILAGLMYAAGLFIVYQTFNLLGRGYRKVTEDRRAYKERLAELNRDASKDIPW